MWETPAGHVKSGETDLQGIKRKNITIDDIKIEKKDVINAKFVSFNEFKTMLSNHEVIDNLVYFIEVYEKYILNN